MTYLARYAHLESPTIFKRGDKIERGDRIGKMGTTGKSTAPHLHFDLIQELVIDHVYRLDEIPEYIKDLESLMLQYRYFLDNELFGTDLEVITFFGDWRYPTDGITPVKDWAFHPGFDVVPKDRHETRKHFDIYWNRGKNGLCVKTGFDDGYGNYAMFMYEV